MGKFAAKQMPAWYLRLVKGETNTPCSSCYQGLPLGTDGNHYVSVVYSAHGPASYHIHSKCTHPKR